MNNDKKTEEQKIENLSRFIDSLNAEKKPDFVLDEEDEEMVKLYETVRAVKRLKSVHEKIVEAPVEKQKKRFPINRFIAIASMFIIFTVVTSMINWPFGGNENVVQAMMKAYEQLESYSGTIEIISYRNDEVDFYETIDVKYKKPNKFLAVHQYDRTNYTQLSDGMALYTIEQNEVTIDYSNPEKELWRYHIGQRIEEIIYAEHIEKVGTEVFNGREATIYQYGASSDDSSHQVWIDDETKLPLKTELILPENRRLINQFKTIEVNANIPDQEFTFQQLPNQSVTELNKPASIEEVKEFWSVDPTFIEQLSGVVEKRGLNLEKVVLLGEREWYTYLVQFSDNNHDTYLDFYFGKDMEDSKVYFSESRLGLLGDGWLEMNDHAINIFKVYIGESNLIRWMKGNGWQVTIVSNLEMRNVRAQLEELTGQKIQEVSKEDLEIIGVLPVETKEGH